MLPNYCPVTGQWHAQKSSFAFSVKTTHQNHDEYLGIPVGSKADPRLYFHLAFVPPLSSFHLFPTGCNIKKRPAQRSYALHGISFSCTRHA